MATFKLKYQKNGSGGYVDVPVGSGSTTSPSQVTSATVASITTASSSWALTNGRPAASAGDLIVAVVAWDDSSTVASVTPPSGPNSESAVSIAGPAASASTEMRLQAWYWIATGSWTTGNWTYTPAASETCRQAAFVIPAGQFNASDPIGWASTSSSAGTTESNINSPTGTAESDDGSGRLFIAFGSDADAITKPASGTTTVNNGTTGGVGLCIVSRNSTVTNSESIASITATIASDSWATLAWVVKPNVVTNEVYIATSSNIAAGGEATTARLTDPGTSSFVTGRRWDDENGTDSITLGDDEYTEVEWKIGIDSPATTSDYYEFRVYDGDTALDGGYTVTPKWTIGSGGINGTSSGTFTVTGAAAGTVAISGTSAATITLTGTAAGAVAVNGTSAGTFTVSGSATGSSLSETSGTSAGTFTLTGTAAGQVQVAGTSAATLTLGGTAACSVEVAGTSSATVSLSGSAAGTVAVSGTSAGTFTASGAASGAVAVSGTSAAAVTLTGTAEGAVGNVPIEGTSAGTFTLAGTSAGAVAIAGTSAATVSLTGTAAGTVDVKGTSAATISLSGSAEGSVGNVPIEATSAGTFTLTGAAAGAVQVAGTSAATISLAGASAGTVAVSGTSIGSFALLGSAEGIVGYTPITGDSAATISVSGTAAGTVAVSGTSAAQVALSGSAEGQILVAGSSAATISVGGSSEGSVTDPDVAIGTSDGVFTLTGSAAGVVWNVADITAKGRARVGKGGSVKPRVGGGGSAKSGIGSGGSSNSRIGPEAP